MKLALILALLAPFQGNAASPETDVVRAYARTVSAQYQSAYAGLVEFKQRVAEFLAVPNARTLRAAREQWVAMRKPYSMTEVYRFYGGPIDGDGGPEGRVNAWPLDEAYLDYVVGDGSAGIINNPARFGALTRQLLNELNEQGGEKNISIGYHAIEFLLWGQDLSSTGAGNRPYTDYVVGRGKNADRRRAYLELATDMLLDDVKWVADQWNSADAGSYAAAFLREDAISSLGKMLTGVYRLAGEELSQERMFVAYDTQSQEDEHSCFSDTTHFDIRYNFEGIRNVLAGKDGPGILALVKARNPALALNLEAKLAETDAAIASIPVPFDNAIFSETGRAAILSSVHALEDLARLTQEAAQILGVEIQ